MLAVAEQGKSPYRYLSIAVVGVLNMESERKRIAARLLSDAWGCSPSVSNTALSASGTLDGCHK